MKTELFDFFLPPDLIAQEPAKERSESRLLVYNRQKDICEHRNFLDIVNYFETGDLLVLNNSRVIPARIYTEPFGYEVLFVKSDKPGFFEAMVRPGRKFKIGRRHLLPGGCEVEVLSITESGLRLFKTLDGSDVLPTFREHGFMPLPPYITSRNSSPERYQTVFSELEGSIAAPTAGLHFDDEVFKLLSDKGVNVTFITLHVGLGTFKTVETDELENHKMHEEHYFISSQTASLFKRTREAGNAVWACGTTTVRALESSFLSQNNLKVGWQSTDCFIKPGYQFSSVDKFITNFHLPRSTLIVLVSAFCSREKVLELYAKAIKDRYRFYSFGDSMLIL